MKKYDPKILAFDFYDLVEGGKQQLLDCIKEWEEAGKPLYPDERIDIDESTLCPFDADGKLAFDAYVYVGFLPNMNEMFEGMKSTGLVEEIYTDFNKDDEEWVDGSFTIITNIKI